MFIRDYERNGRTVRVVSLSDKLTPFEVDMHLHERDYRKNIILVIELERTEDMDDTEYNILYYRDGCLQSIRGDARYIDGHVIDMDSGATSVSVFKGGFDFSLFPNPTDDEIEMCNESMRPQTEEEFMNEKSYYDRCRELAKKLDEIDFTKCLN